MTAFLSCLPVERCGGEDDTVLCTEAAYGHVRYRATGLAYPLCRRHFTKLKAGQSAWRFDFEGEAVEEEKTKPEAAYRPLDYPKEGGLHECNAKVTKAIAVINLARQYGKLMPWETPGGYQERVEEVDREIKQHNDLDAQAVGGVPKARRAMQWCKRMTRPLFIRVHSKFFPAPPDMPTLEPHNDHLRNAVDYPPTGNPVCRANDGHRLLHAGSEFRIPHEPDGRAIALRQRIRAFRDARATAQAGSR